MSIRTWWSRTSADLPRPFWYLMVGTFVNRIGFVVEPFLALYLSGPRHLAPSTIGVVLACFGAGSLASQMIGGYLADRVGRRLTLVLGMVGSAGCFMLLASVRHLALIAVASVLTGLFIDVYRPALSAAVADLVPEAARPRAFALIYWAVNIGVAAAGVLGGVLADRSFWLLFLLDAVTCLGFALIIARGVPETRPASVNGKTGSYVPVLRDGLALGLSACIVASTLVYAQQMSTLPLAVRASGLSAGAFGLIYAVNPVVVIAVQPFVLWLIDRLPDVPTVAVSSLFLGVGFGLTAFAHSIPTFGLTVLIWTIGEIGFNAVTPALIVEIAPAELRGRYSGLLGMSYAVSFLIGPLVGTWTFGISPGLLWSACLAVAGLSAVGTLTLGPAIARRRGARETPERGAAGTGQGTPSTAPAGPRPSTGAVS